MAAERGWRRNLGVITRLLLVGAWLALLYAITDLGRATRMLAHASPALVALAFFLLLIRLPLMVLRWQVVLADLGIRLPFRNLMRISLVSTFFGIALPSANGGDLVRGMMLKNGNTEWGSIAASILVDRLYGVLSLLLLALPGNLWLYTHGHHTLPVMIIAGASAVALAACAAVPFLSGLLQPVPDAGTEGPLGRLLRAARAMALACARSRSFALCLAFSLISQFLAAVAAYVTSLSLGFDIGFSAYIAFVPIVWLTTSLPLSIAGVGIREATFAGLFLSLGVQPDQSIAIGLINSALSLCIGILGAAAFFFPKKCPPET